MIVHNSLLGRDEIIQILLTFSKQGNTYKKQQFNALFINKQEKNNAIIITPRKECAIGLNDIEGIMPVLRGQSTHGFSALNLSQHITIKGRKVFQSLEHVALDGNNCRNAF